MKDGQIDEFYYWERFKEGDRNALGFFYKKYYNLLYNYGLKLHNDPVLIEDFIQDIFYKLCKREYSKPISNVKVYLVRAMRNIIYDYYASRKEIIRMEDMTFTLPSDDTLFNSLFAKDDTDLEKWKSLLAAINSLPNQQKQILYLFYIKGLSHKEISKILDIKAQSSMNSISKSLKRIQALVNGDDLLLWVFFLFLRSYN